jgi:hypothetical protein
MAAAGTVAQIPIDFGHGRSREAGQMKEDDEGIPFHTLLTVGTHRGDRILWKNMRRRLCSSVLGGCTISGGSAGHQGAGHVAEPPELFRLKCASHRYLDDTKSTHFKQNNSLVCRVSARYNHGSTGSK